MISNIIRNRGNLLKREQDYERYELFVNCNNKVIYVFVITR